MRIVDWIGEDQARFDQLFKLFTGKEYRIVQHAAWPLSYAVERHPALIGKHFSSLVKLLERKQEIPAVRRNILRLLQHTDIPEKYQGAIMDRCFDYISDPVEAPAVKAFSITVLANLSKQYPEIIPEFRLILEQNFARESPAFRSRAAKLLKRWS